MGTLAVETNLFMVSNGFPNVTTSGQQYNIGDKPSVILYTTYINLHAGTQKPQSFLSVEEFRTTVVVIWSNRVYGLREVK